MDYFAFKNIIDEEKGLHPGWFDLDIDEPADDNSIRQVEDDFGMLLPQDYKDLSCWISYLQRSLRIGRLHLLS